MAWPVECCLRHCHAKSHIPDETLLQKKLWRKGTTRCTVGAVERFSVNGALVRIEHAIKTKMPRHGIKDKVNIIIVMLGTGSAGRYWRRGSLFVYRLHCIYFFGGVLTECCCVTSVDILRLY